MAWILFLFWHLLQALEEAVSYLATAGIDTALAATYFHDYSELEEVGSVCTRPAPRIHSPSCRLTPFQLRSAARLSSSVVCCCLQLAGLFESIWIINQWIMQNNHTLPGSVNPWHAWWLLRRAMCQARSRSCTLRPVLPGQS